MKYIIIGLGNYGHVLAEELSTLGRYYYRCCKNSGLRNER